MSTYQSEVAHELARIIAALPTETAAMQRRYTEQFFAKMPLSELQKLHAETACALAASTFIFMQNRLPGQPIIRLFQPNAAEHGWHSTRLVIQLVNDDMPFLVDSLTNALTALGFTIYETIHPILRVLRNEKHLLQDIVGNKEGKPESFIHFEISRLPDSMSAEMLVADLQYVLRHVRAAVTDWPLIETNTKNLLAALSNQGAETQEIHDFLDWLLDRNFVFLGIQSYAGNTQPDAKMALGVLRLMQHEETTPELHADNRIEISKSSHKSLVHRAVPMDVITIHHQGIIHQLVGLFTSNVYYQTADDIPIVRRKMSRVLERAGFDPASHDGKALKTILEFLPRDEILQIGEEDLFATSIGILALEAKPGVRLFARYDPYGRYMSVMVFTPRERFSTELRLQIQALLEKASGAYSSNFYTQISESPLARLHVILRLQGEKPPLDIAALEAEIARLAYQWGDLLRAELLTHFGEEKSETVYRQFSSCFSQGYIERTRPQAALADIEKMLQAIASGQIALELFYSKHDTPPLFHLKIYNPAEEIALSDILPTLENMGFRVMDEYPFLITPQGGGSPIWIRDITLKLGHETTFLFDQVKPLFEETLLRILHKKMEDDRFNALVLLAGINFRQVVLLRALAHYMKQTGFSHSQTSIEQTLIQYPGIARELVALFTARFEPGNHDVAARQQYLLSNIENALSNVSNLTEDTIIRRYLALINAMLRTNYFQEQRPVLSFKFRSALVPELPLPIPYAEIFVYSPRVEGIHLRGGKVARGGLRWSDRPDDFRTEVLGLMKAQMVKNSVIVPVGSKGGFVLKHPPAQRAALQTEGISCYKLYLSGLLDITDNIVDGSIVAPEHVVRHDEDDPYLVVAADKGTASFSDIANGVSHDYGFWLGDAFASGGSVGYDHKKMAITARGAWVSVVRHFHEMGKDIANEAFTVAGIGDMAGDVFGNGMLLSDKLKLVAAFNHLHIFLDPTPDEKISFTERKRLFEKPGTSWKDYDPALISKGGGIFERSAKTIALSAEIRAVLQVGQSNLTPDELIRAILRSPVDLLWNGGIGTYVKGEDETHEQVGDRANNALRINGRELRASVVGEGGNLGFTQKGRVEYARQGAQGVGGRINTDAIDNSAGVDCSDHEVNIKIAFSGALSAGRVTLVERDALLVEMTDDVAQLVLRDNILQTQALTIAEQQGVGLVDSHLRLIHHLEEQGILNRAVEFLPSDKQVQDLKAGGKSLTRPELAILLAYAKIALYHEILASSLPDEPYFADELLRYFPAAMRERHADDINAHPLKREIIATCMTNSLVNRTGAHFIFAMQEETGLAIEDIAKAYTIVRDAFGLRDLWAAIEALDGQLAVNEQTKMFEQINRFVGHVTAWLLRNESLPIVIPDIMMRLTNGLAEFRKQFQLQQTLHTTLASLPLIASAPDVLQLSHQSKQPIVTTTERYLALGALLEIPLLMEATNHLLANDYWDRVAIASVLSELQDEQRRLTQGALSFVTLEEWEAPQSAALARYAAMMVELKRTEQLTLPKLLVALRQLKSLK